VRLTNIDWSISPSSVAAQERHPEAIYEVSVLFLRSFYVSRSVSRSTVRSSLQILRTDFSTDLETIFVVTCSWVVSDILDESSRVLRRVLPRIMTA